MHIKKEIKSEAPQGHINFSLSVLAEVGLEGPLTPASSTRAQTPPDQAAHRPAPPASTQQQQQQQQQQQLHEPLTPESERSTPAPLIDSSGADPGLDKCRSLVRKICQHFGRSGPLSKRAFLAFCAKVDDGTNPASGFIDMVMRNKDRSFDSSKLEMEMGSAIYISASVLNKHSAEAKRLFKNYHEDMRKKPEPPKEVELTPEPSDIQTVPVEFRLEVKLMPLWVISSPGISYDAIVLSCTEIQHLLLLLPFHEKDRNTARIEATSIQIQPKLAEGFVVVYNKGRSFDCKLITDYDNFETVILNKRNLQVAPTCVELPMMHKFCDQYEKSYKRHLLTPPEYDSHQGSGNKTNTRPHLGRIFQLGTVKTSVELQMRRHLWLKVADPDVYYLVILTNLYCFFMAVDDSERLARQIRIAVHASKKENFSCSLSQHWAPYSYGHSFGVHIFTSKNSETGSEQLKILFPNILDKRDFHVPYVTFAGKRVHDEANFLEGIMNAESLVLDMKNMHILDNPDISNKLCELKPHEQAMVPQSCGEEFQMTRRLVTPAEAILQINNKLYEVVLLYLNELDDESESLPQNSLFARSQAEREGRKIDVFVISGDVALQYKRDMHEVITKRRLRCTYAKCEKWDLSRELHFVPYYDDFESMKKSFEVKMPILTRRSQLTSLFKSSNCCLQVWHQPRISHYTEKCRLEDFHDDVIETLPNKSIEPVIYAITHNGGPSPQGTSRCHGIGRTPPAQHGSGRTPPAQHGSGRTPPAPRDIGPQKSPRTEARPAAPANPLHSLTPPAQAFSNLGSEPAPPAGSAPPAPASAPATTVSKNYGFSWPKPSPCSSSGIRPSPQLASPLSQHRILVQLEKPAAGPKSYNPRDSAEPVKKVQTYSVVPEQGLKLTLRKGVSSSEDDEHSNKRKKKKKSSSSSGKSEDQRSHNRRKRGLTSSEPEKKRHKSSSSSHSAADRRGATTRSKHRKDTTSSANRKGTNTESKKVARSEKSSSSGSRKRAASSHKEESSRRTKRKQSSSHTGVTTGSKATKEAPKKAATSSETPAAAAKATTTSPSDSNTSPAMVSIHESIKIEADSDTDSAELNPSSKLQIIDVHSVLPSPFCEDKKPDIHDEDLPQPPEPMGPPQIINMYSISEDQYNANASLEEEDEQDPDCNALEKNNTATATHKTNNKASLSLRDVLSCIHKKKAVVFIAKACRDAANSALRQHIIDTCQVRFADAHLRADMYEPISTDELDSLDAAVPSKPPVPFKRSRIICTKCPENERVEFESLDQRDLHFAMVHDPTPQSCPSPAPSPSEEGSFSCQDCSPPQTFSSVGGVSQHKWELNHVNVKKVS